MSAAKLGANWRAGSPEHSARTLPVLALGMALSLFLAVSYLICVSTYFVPGLPISHAMLTIFLPGFVLLSWQSFSLGSWGASPGGGMSR